MSYEIMMNDVLNVSFLALVQGLTEFLPISSSGHLVLLQHVLKVPESIRLQLEVFLHLGTLLAIFVYYRASLASLFKGLLKGEKASIQFLVNLGVSLIPALMMYACVKNKLDVIVSQTRLVGGLLIVTGIILLATRFMRAGMSNLRLPSALAMGLAQACALFPGLSRSGLTLATARACGIASVQAAEFSFLMCAPLILGGTILESIKAVAQPVPESIPLGLLLWGVILSGVVGYFALAGLVKILKGSSFWLFGPYCMGAGALIIFLN